MKALIADYTSINLDHEGTQIPFVLPLKLKQNTKVFFFLCGWKIFSHHLHQGLVSLSLPHEM